MEKIYNKILEGKSLTEKEQEEIWELLNFNGRFNKNFPFRIFGCDGMNINSRYVDSNKKQIKKGKYTHFP